MSRVDAWIAAAAQRDSAAPRKPPQIEPNAPETAPDYEALLAATEASERRAIETAAKTAEALGSVTSWIETAQSQINASVGTLDQRLAEIEKKSVAVPDVSEALRTIEAKLASPPAAAPRSASDFEAAMRSFEGRISTLTERLDTAPRPLGRRGLAAADEVRNAVAEIREHQLRIDSEPAPDRHRPALGTLARSQTAILTTLKADVARLANRMDEAPAPAPALAPALAAPPVGQTDRVQEEIETLRRSMTEVATRDDLGRLERGLQALTADITELRMAGQRQSGASDIAALQAEIRSLAERSPAVETGHLGRDIELLSHKLDVVAANGVDAKAIGSLAGQIDEVQRLLTGAAAPQALVLVDSHLADLRREITAVGGRQIGSDEFAALRATVDDIQSSLSGITPGRAPGHEMVQAVRDLGQPIETMLTTLIDKLDRVERRVSDPDALDHLERQIQGLASRLGESGGRDPALAAIERQMASLLSEVAGWRDGAVQAAERAARAAVTETMGTLPDAAALERHLAELGDYYAAAENRTQDSLVAVHSTLDDVIHRLTTLERTPSAPAAFATTPAVPLAPVPLAAPALLAAASAAPRPSPPPLPAEPAASARPSGGPPPLPAMPPRPAASAPQEADEPLPPADEVLLEPGAARPGGRPRVGSVDERLPGEADIKSSFIAAARRAAQAAAAETGGQRGQDSRSARSGASFSPMEIARRVRQMIDERRRPLLLSAAALVLAIGTAQVVRTALDDAAAQKIGGPIPVAAIAPAPQPAPSASPAPKMAEVRIAPEPAPAALAAPAPAALAAPILPDPATTASIGARSGPAGEARTPIAASATASADRREEAARVVVAAVSPEAQKAVAALPPAAATPAPTPASIPSAARAALGQDAANVLPPGLKQAAAAGNPIALYELASRTTEGRGVARDPKAAAALFEKAADKGLVPAQYRVGNNYERGIGVARDLDAARTWYRRAAENGNVRAMHNLAVLIAEGGGGKPDYPAAITWFTKAAEHGVRDSQYNLAVLHARGLGTAPDLARSYVWLALAAQQGDEDAGRKRDEIGQRLSAPDLAKAKTTVERWHAAAANPAANEVQAPAGGWPDAGVRRATR